MSEVSDRYRKVAAGFTARVEAVPEGGWDRPSPCEEWVARDVVGHVVDTGQHFVGRVGLELPAGHRCKRILSVPGQRRNGILAALDDPAVATLEFDSPMGTTTLERFIGLFGVGDVLVHTWDLARATGLDERLDAEEVHRLFAALEPNDEMMRKGNAFGPRVDVDPDADEQTRLLAFSGRQV